MVHLGHPTAGPHPEAHQSFGRPDRQFCRDTAYVRDRPARIERAAAALRGGYSCVVVVRLRSVAERLYAILSGPIRLLGIGSVETFGCLCSKGFARHRGVPV
jgi:hypothetical protein